MASKKDNFFGDNVDIQFHLQKRVDFAALFALIPPEEKAAMDVDNADDFKNVWLETLSSLGELCGSQFAVNAGKVEQEDLQLDLVSGDVTLGLTMQQNIRALRDIGACGMGISPEYGGIGGPFIAEVASGELISRACPSTYLNAVWYAPIAHVLESFASDEIKQTYIPRIASGEISGSMALTEPDAGSDLGAIRTYGEKQADGSWRLYGTKRFISNGDAAISLVLAKNQKGAQGLKALNLYLVERKVDGKPNFLVTKLEEKVALHGSATCELQFDGAKAILIGKEGEGFRYMSLLMNVARVAVGFQGLGMMDAIWRLAADYAQQRRAMGKPIARHELIAEKLLDMEVEVKAFRSLCYQAAFYMTLVNWTEKKLGAAGLADDERTQLERSLGMYQKRVRNWTPLIKWWCGERTVAHARTAMQILGGYGYTKEYRAEWWLREALILPIYEGTSQIQALMCIKDTLKSVIRQPTAFIEVALGLKVAALSQTDPLVRKLNRMKQTLNSAVVAILFKMVKENVRSSFSEVKPSDVLRLVKILAKDLVKFENLSPALLHAERVCEMKALVAMGNCLIRDAATDPSRRWVAERFINKSLPAMVRLKAEIEIDEPVLAQRLSGRESPDDAVTRQAGGKL